MLVRPAYLAVSNAFAALRLLPVSDREKDIETLTLRHQISVLQRQLGAARPRPRTVASARRLVLRLARENPAWGSRRIHGELAMLGIKVGASTVWQMLKDAGIEPAPHRAATTWTAVLRSQAEAILACDLLQTVTLDGQRHYMLAVIEHATRRIRILGATAHPTAAWVAQAARNLTMDLQDAGATVKYLIRDRDAKFPTVFDDVLADAGIALVHDPSHNGRMRERS